MSIGAKNRRLRFQRATLVDDGLSRVEAWTDLFTVWGSKADVSDAERWRADAVGATVTSRFRVRRSRATSAVTRSDRIVCEGVVYGITGIKEIERSWDLELTAAAEVE